MTATIIELIHQGLTIAQATKSERKAMVEFLKTAWACPESPESIALNTALNSGTLAEHAILKSAASSLLPVRGASLYLSAAAWGHCFVGNRESTVRWLYAPSQNVVPYAEIRDGIKWDALSADEVADIHESLVDNDVSIQHHDFDEVEYSDDIPSWVPKTVAMKHVDAYIKTQPTDLTAAASPAVVINCARFFRHPEFIRWLNDPSITKFTWHQPGTPAGEYSDVVVLVDPSLNGEGSDSDSLPHSIWGAIVEACRSVYPNGSGHLANHLMVRLCNAE